MTLAAMPSQGACTETETHAIEEILHRIASNLGLLMDHEIAIDAVEVERWDERPAGRDQVHVSFKLGLDDSGNERHGCLLLPLPEAITLAGYLMMVGDDEVTENRALETLDRGMKDAMLELSNFVASAIESAFSDLDRADLIIRSDGCQGVRADVRPALAYTEGDPLVVGRAQVRIHEYPEFEALLILPEPTVV